MMRNNMIENKENPAFGQVGNAHIERPVMNERDMYFSLLEEKERELEETQSIRRGFAEKGEVVESIPDGYDKVYYYGRYEEIELYRYPNFVIVYNTSTGVKRRFDNKQDGFDYAKTVSRAYRQLEWFFR